MTRPKEVYFKEGCFIEEWLNTPDDPELSIARVRVEPHKQTRLHALKNTTERYVILNGRALVSIGESTSTISQGDVVTIQPDEPQKIENLEATDLIFLAVCNPRFEEKNYIDLEQ